MKPLSAIAVSVFLLILGMTWLTWITASAHTLGIFAIIAVVVVLLDTFWFGSERWIPARRDRSVAP